MDPESTQLQQAQLAAILGPDPSPFETLISHLMSSSNEQRSQAELIFNSCKQNEPDSLSLKLANTIQCSPHAEIRAMSAILLRMQLTRLTRDCSYLRLQFWLELDDSYFWPSPTRNDSYLWPLPTRNDSYLWPPPTRNDSYLWHPPTRNDSYLWPRLSKETQSSLKSILLACVQREDAKTISKKLCDTVSELASGILPENGWPELLPFMFQCVSSDSPKLQESAFFIIAQLSQFIGETLIPHIKDLHGLFLQRLSSSSSSDVKIAVLSAAINSIQFLSCPSDPGRFQDLLPPMMRMLMEALNCGQEATAQEALVLFIELAGTKPQFFIGRPVDVVGAMFQIVEAESLEEGTRHLAIEFVITLFKAGVGTLHMMSRLFVILMKMLLDIEDDPAWHSAESEDEDAGETSDYSVGQECLYRLAKSGKVNTIVKVALEQLPAYLAAPEWQKHHAALIALARIAEGCAEGCAEEMIKNLRQVVTTVLDSIQDPPHPRVHWAAMNAFWQIDAIWQLSKLGPGLHGIHVRRCEEMIKNLQQMLTMVLNSIQDPPHPRVRSAAINAIWRIDAIWQLSNSGGGLHGIHLRRCEVMIKNLGQVVTMVLNSFQDPHPRVRWAAINAISQLDAISQLSNLGAGLQVRCCERVAFALVDVQNPRVQGGTTISSHAG